MREKSQSSVEVRLVRVGWEGGGYRWEGLLVVVVNIGR